MKSRTYALVAVYENEIMGVHINDHVSSYVSSSDARAIGEALNILDSDSDEILHRIKEMSGVGEFGGFMVVSSSIEENGNWEIARIGFDEDTIIVKMKDFERVNSLWNP